MDQLQLNDQVLVTTPPRFDTIPEDAALQIAKVIQSWTEIDGSREKREKARRARDSALRAISLSCRKSFTLYHPILLQKVSVHLFNVFSLFKSLEMNEDHGKLVKSFRCIANVIPIDEARHQNALDFFRYSSLPHVSETSEEHNAHLESGIKNVIDSTFGKLDQLQSLSVENSRFMFPFQHQINGRSAPLPMFASLKSLFVAQFQNRGVSLTGRNVVWLLILCQNLKTASLGCTLSSDDFRFLEEHSEAFATLSNVEHLALSFTFVFDETDRRTLWDSPNSERAWKGGNKKTESLIHLFSVLKNKNLTSLELADVPDSSYPNERSLLSISCLSGLQSSFGTIQHLSLAAIAMDSFSLQYFQLDLLDQLKILSVEIRCLVYLVSTRELELPKSLETIILSFHTVLPSATPEPTMNLLQGKEGAALARLLREKTIPSLKTVIIPLQPIDSSGSQIKVEVFRKNWSEGVRELEKLEVFTSGRVKLRKVEPEELCGEFIFGRSWLSMP